MSEASRQRWLHVRNRLEELNARLGQLEDEPLPEWLDHYPERPEAARIAPQKPVARAQGEVQRPGLPLDEGHV